MKQEENIIESLEEELEKSNKPVYIYANNLGERTFLLKTQIENLDDLMEILKGYEYKSFSVYVNGKEHKISINKDTNDSTNNALIEIFREMKQLLLQQQQTKGMDITQILPLLTGMNGNNKDISKILELFTNKE